MPLGPSLASNLTVLHRDRYTLGPKGRQLTQQKKGRSLLVTRLDNPGMYVGVDSKGGRDYTLILNSWRWIWYLMC